MAGRAEPSYWAASEAEDDMNLHESTRKAAEILPHVWTVARSAMSGAGDCTEEEHKEVLIMAQNLVLLRAHLVIRGLLTAVPKEVEIIASVLRNAHLVDEADTVAPAQTLIKVSAGKGEEAEDRTEIREKTSTAHDL